MSFIIDFIVDVATAAWDAFVEVLEAVWDEVVMPILEEIFALFGIEDEVIVSVQRISSPIYATNVEDVVQAGVSRAVLRMVKFEDGFFPNYMKEIFKTKAQIRSYYRYGELNLYYNGLPDMEIKGTVINFGSVQAALDELLGSTHTILSAVNSNPTADQWYFEEMQTTHDYQPWTNTLTYDSIEGWFVDEIDYNSGTDDYTIYIHRVTDAAEMYIQGPEQITEGDTATYTVRCNKPVPDGSGIEINFAYSGTAVDGVDFTEVAQVTMLQGTKEITVDLVTDETGNANRTMIITIDSLTDNSGTPFETLNINALDSVTTVITDDDSLVLTMADQLVDEANTTLVIPVTLNQAAPSGAFTVDYDFTDLGGITGGVDYDNTPGTLNFAGTDGEIQNISVEIYADLAYDDQEQFEIFLENSSDVDGIDISAVAKITIIDNTSEPGTVYDSFTKTPAFTPEPSMIVTYSDDSDPPGEFYYWIYAHSEGTYDLVPVHTILADLEMLPLAILRKDKTQLDVLYGPTDPEFITTKLLMARAGLDIDDFLTAIAENPSIGDIDDAYINFSMQPLDTNPVLSKMLYFAWHEIIVAQGLDSNVDSLSATLIEGDIQNAIVWSGHTFTAGNVGVVAAEGAYTHSINGTTLTMQYQITSGTYDQIVMTNLNGVTTINYQVYHEVALCVLGDDSFTIPVSWNTFQLLTAQEQMEVYQYLCRVDVNAVNLTHLEWYETEAFYDLFEFVLAVISVVVIIFTLGAATTLVAGIVGLVEMLVVNYAIGELIMFIAEATGSNLLAALAGVVAAVYLGDASVLTDVMLMEATVLIDLATNFASTFMALESMDEMEEIEELIETSQAAAEKLEAERKTRPNLSALDANDTFYASLKGVDVNQLKAIESQYGYDQLYNYDSLVRDFVNNKLQLGVT